MATTKNKTTGKKIETDKEVTLNKNTIKRKTANFEKNSSEN